MIPRNHLPPLPPPNLILQLLLKPLKRALLNNPRVSGEVIATEQPFRISNAFLQLVDGRVFDLFTALARAGFLFRGWPGGWGGFGVFAFLFLEGLGHSVGLWVGDIWMEGIVNW